MDSIGRGGVAGAPGDGYGVAEDVGGGGGGIGGVLVWDTISI